ncbi:Phosphomevalonate kinase, peroxisomal [Camellia lanceoleosa]|uniref:Phosphomevalonate kinase, peroxisomal n=1 Tax=Camellia lanceoleosa TaxID=1840588 RepID=A0ACC0HH08_9ERIC|nr:Phosphomevalonate kinase, peroxisomal [Camellia lanceoleosa]
MCRAQELDLDIALKNTFCLPLCALNHSSLRVLKLNLNWGNLKLPNVEFNSLQELSLIKFRAVNALLGEWISSYCKALTNLSLRVFYGMSNLNIISSSLQDMKITFHDVVCDVKISAVKPRTLFEGRRMGHGGGFRTGKSLIIFAPNLQEFKYVGDLVYISCSVVVSDYPLSRAMIDRFIKFFCCLSKARKMEVTGLLRSYVTKIVLQQCHENLWHLTIHDGPYKNSFRVPLLASFLKSSPNLRYLRMRYNGGHQPNILNFNGGGRMLTTQAQSWDAEWWESAQFLFVNGLKEVEIELSDDENEVELIKYLLKHAKSLGRMTIFYSPRDISRSVKIISQKLKAFTKASSTEYAVQYAVAIALVTLEKDKNDLLHKLLLQGLDITILGCNDFYSYRNQSKPKFNGWNCFTVVDDMFAFHQKCFLLLRMLFF